MRSSPTASDVRAAREAAGLTQSQAARLIYVSASAWRKWETEGGAESRGMPTGLFVLFLLVTRQIKLSEVVCNTLRP